jgi:cytochrome c oxidase assembly protein subunit 15
MTSPTAAARPWLRRATKLVAIATFVLLIAGGMVTSTGSGLAVPDWPLSFGQIMPEMRGGVLYEHGHRIIASVVGLMIVIQGIWLQRAEPRSWVRRLGWAAVAGVVVQGLLGGLTVLLRLPDPVSIGHAALAELVFALTVTIALACSRGWARAGELPQRIDRRTPALATLATGLALLVWLQILLGAWVRHAGAGLAIPTFPLSYGQLVPPLDSQPVALHFAHRVGAVVVALAVLWVVSRAWRDHRDESWLLHPALLLAILVAGQIGLGGWTVLAHKHPWVATAHLGTGACLFATSVVLALRTRRRVRPAPFTVHPPLEPIRVGAR